MRRMSESSGDEATYTAAGNTLKRGYVRIRYGDRVRLWNVAESGWEGGGAPPLPPHAHTPPPKGYRGHPGLLNII